MKYVPPARTYHLDSRADQLIAIGEAAGPTSEELPRAEVARWLGTTSTWVQQREREGELISKVEVIRKPPTFRLQYLPTIKRGNVLAFLRKRRRLAETRQRLAEKPETLTQSSAR